MSRERLTFEEIAESAELAVNKLHREYPSQGPGKRDKLGAGEGDGGLYYNYANSSHGTQR
ncbi:hypothetical protein J7337_003375 [Fusarium musae]|uniref:Uncharacterized protein n=1 Tax=Fusarium musae TaxID=1042133 RepID=A0A9P8IUZ4_9HYPO|nr:hypothetical protein J7337_003375 [Fusarium musae]KAG9506392.1 hypothetical protein J7337_003375 [Fusarium musae]